MYNKIMSALENSINDPSLFIPDSLVKVVDRSRVIVRKFGIELGPFRDRYQPTLSVLIAELNGLEQPTNLQEETGGWGHVINHHRRLAISQGILSEKDRILFSLIVNEVAECGLKIETVVKSSTLRPTVGRAFLGNLGEVAKEANYEFIYGETYPAALNYFRRLGYIPLDRLDLAQFPCLKYAGYDAIYPELTVVKLLAEQSN